VRRPNDRRDALRPGLRGHTVTVGRKFSGYLGSHMSLGSSWSWVGSPAQALRRLNPASFRWLG